VQRVDVLEGNVGHLGVRTEMRPDVQVDQAVELYEQGLSLVKQLEGHVSKAENKIKQLALQAVQAKD